VGNNGETLVADSSTSTGLRYQAPKVQNGLYNSSMQVWQRGTSFTAINSYTADRWFKGVASANTVTRQVTNDTTNLPNIQYCLRSQKNSGSTSITALEVVQNLETLDSIKFVGKTVTLSFYARAGANFSATAFASNIFSGTGTDQNILGSGYTGQATVASGSHTLTTTWQRFSITGTVATSATELCVYFNATMTSAAAGANDWFEITGVQLEVGSVATPYTSMTGTIQGELAACQRYYWRNTATNSQSNFAIGVSTSSTNASALLQHPVAMRTAPTSVDYASLAISDGVNYLLAVSSLTLVTDQKSTLVSLLDCTNASGATGWRTSYLRANSTTAGYVGLSAEL
jgi:hypothetical protein